MKRRAFFLVAVSFFLLAQTAAWAALREEWQDNDHDGKKETHMFFDGKTPVRAETDTNGDGKPDLFMRYENGVRSYAEESKKHDGKIDTWYWYNREGRLLQKAHDSNGDGKPDQFSSFVNGDRSAVTREYDRNFDGKIDRRIFLKWDAAKTIPVMNGTRLTRIPNPGYATVWEERDDNYDGIIDYYRDKKDKTHDKKGQPIDPRPIEVDVMRQVPAPQRPAGPPSKAPSGQGKSEEAARVDDFNDRYSLVS